MTGTVDNVTLTGVWACAYNATAATCTTFQGLAQEMGWDVEHPSPRRPVLPRVRLGDVYSFPFSTPGISPVGSVVAYTTCVFNPGEEGGSLIVADMMTGALVSYYTGAPGAPVGFSRSSVTVDKEGCTWQCVF